MTSGHDPSKGPPAARGDSKKAERLAQALRDNLAKRKQLQRARVTGAGETDAAGNPVAAPPAAPPSTAASTPREGDDE